MSKCYWLHLAACLSLVDWLVASADTREGILYPPQRSAVCSALTIGGGSFEIDGDAAGSVLTMASLFPVPHAGLIHLIGTSKPPDTNAVGNDPVGVKLDAVKVQYATEMDRVGKHLSEWLDKRETTGRKDGDKKLIDQTKAQRAAFKENSVLPEDAPSALKKEAAGARAKMEAGFELAIKEYTKLGKDDQAASVEKELLALRDRIASERRDKWVHQKGSFKVTKKGEWEEVISGKTTHRFNEIARTFDYVELEHVTGTTRVRLYKDRCDVASRPFNEFKTFYSGKWSR